MSSKKIKTLSAITGALLIIALSTYWIGSSESALRWAANKAVQGSGGVLTLEGVSGSLFQGVGVSQLSLYQKETLITGDGVTIRWSPWSLLWGTIKFTDLHVKTLQVVLPPSTGQPPKLPAHLKPPMRVTLTDIAIDRLLLRREQATIAVHNASGDIVLGRRAWVWRVKSPNTPVGAAHIDLNLGTTRPFTIRGDVRVIRDSATPYASNLKLSGSLTQTGLGLTFMGGGASARGSMVLTPFHANTLQQLDLNVQGINPRGWRANAPAANVRLDAKARTDANGQVNGSYAILNSIPGRLDEQRIPLVSAGGALYGQTRNMNFHQLRLDLGPAGQFAGDGTWRDSVVNLQIKTVNLNLQGVQNSIRPTQMVGSIGLNTEGEGQQLRIALKDKHYGFDVDARHAQQKLIVSRALLRAGSGSFAGKGTLALEQNREFEVSGQLLGLDPAEFGKKSPRGALRGTVTATGQLLPQLSTRANFNIAHGRLFNEAVSGSGNLQTKRTKDGIDLAIKTKLAIGATRASAEGTVIDPAGVKKMDLRFILEGENLAKLYTILNIPLPATPAYKLAGHLRHDNKVWRFSKFTGAVGASDLSGDFSVDYGGARKFMRADLVSRNLDLKDLAGFVGAPAKNSSAEEESKRVAVERSGRVLPQGRFNLSKLHAADADVNFKGTRIQTQKLPIEDMTAHLKLNNGKLTLEPLNFGVAGGDIVSTIIMDANVKNIQTQAQIRARHLELKKLFPGFKLTKASVGTLGGNAKVVGTGSSVADMLGSMDGELAVIMGGGTLSELLLRLANLDIQNTALVLLTGDKQIPVQCMVADFKAQNGMLNTQAMVIDTGKENITGSGTINLRDEILNMKLVAHPKDTSFIALRGPILIDGPFKKPSVRPEMGGVLARTALATALAAVAGPLGLIPLIDLGEETESNCETLMAEARQVSAPALKKQSKSAR